MGKVAKRGRGRPARFAGAELKAVVALLKKTMSPGETLAILGAVNRFGKVNPRVAMRPAEFTTPQKVALLTLCRIGAEAGLKFQRGRPNPIVGKKAELHAVSLVKKHGASGAAAILATEGVSVSIPKLCKLAAANDVKLVRGRRKAA